VKFLKFRAGRIRGDPARRRPPAENAKKAVNGPLRGLPYDFTFFETDPPSTHWNFVEMGVFRGGPARGIRGMVAGMKL